MRRRNPNGRFIESPEEPRLLVPAPPGTRGQWELLGGEGLDNDGDGDVNEDGVGGYDPNRNWPWRWMPNYVQGGADFYPTSLPETRAVIDFVVAHPNIAGRAELPQQRRDDPARSRIAAGRVPAAGRAGVRPARSHG